MFDFAKELSGGPPNHRKKKFFSSTKIGLCAWRRMEGKIDKVALREEAARIAHELIEADQVDRGAEVLADYQRRFGNNDDDYLKRGLAMMFILDLVRDCRANQCRRVGYLIDEHAVEFVTRSNLHALRERELMMYQKYGDASGIAKCLRLLEKLDGML